MAGMFARRWLTARSIAAACRFSCAPAELDGRCLRRLLVSKRSFPAVQPRSVAFRCFSSDPRDEKKPSLFQRFKQMYRDYWYVLVPVHLVTSAAWFGGFYYMAVSGVDIVSFLEALNVSDKIVNPLRDSKMGYVAVAYALYKISTPARYAVTLGGTTLSINYLKRWGYIKPVPTREALKEMYKEKKEKYKERTDEIMVSMREKREVLKDRRDRLMGDFDRKLRDSKKDMGKKTNLLEDDVKGSGKSK